MAQWFRQIFESAPTTPSSNIDYNEGLGLLPAQSQPDQSVALPENRIPVDVGRGLMADDFSLRESMRPADDIRIVNFDDAYGPQTEAGEDAVDLTLKFAQGTIMGSRMLVDAFGADSEVSKSFRGAEEYLDAMMSAGAREDKQAIARLAEQAKNEGVFDQLVTGFEMLKVDPAGTIVQALGTSVPVIAGTVLATLTGGTVAGLGVGLGLGATQGSGIVKGAIYETVKQELLKIGMPEQEAESRAVRAQEWGGENTDQILTGAGITALGAITGLESAAVNALIRKFSQDVAKKTSVQAGTNIGLETVTEGAQGFQEQTARNIATQRQGDALGNQELSDTPTTGGAYAQGVMEAGAGMGAATVTTPLTMSSQEEEAPAPLTTSSPNYGTVEIKSPKGGNLTVGTLSAEETESLASEPMMARRYDKDENDEESSESPLIYSRISRLADNQKFISQLPPEGTADDYGKQLLRFANRGAIDKEELADSEIMKFLNAWHRDFSWDKGFGPEGRKITQERFLEELRKSTPQKSLVFIVDEQQSESGKGAIKSYADYDEHNFNPDLAKARWQESIETKLNPIMGASKTQSVPEILQSGYPTSSQFKQLMSWVTNELVDLYKISSVQRTAMEEIGGDPSVGTGTYVSSEMQLETLDHAKRLIGYLRIFEDITDDSKEHADIFREWISQNEIMPPQMAEDSFRIMRQNGWKNAELGVLQAHFFSRAGSRLKQFVEGTNNYAMGFQNQFRNDNDEPVDFVRSTEAYEYGGGDPANYIGLAIAPRVSNDLQLMQGGQPEYSYHGSFSDANQRVFTRLTDMQDDATGERLLHIEELQSDLLNNDLGVKGENPIGLPSENVEMMAQAEEQTGEASTGFMRTAARYHQQLHRFFPASIIDNFNPRGGSYTENNGELLYYPSFGGFINALESGEMELPADEEFRQMDRLNPTGISDMSRKAGRYIDSFPQNQELIEKSFGLNTYDVARRGSGIHQIEVSPVGIRLLHADALFDHAKKSKTVSDLIEYWNGESGAQIPKIDYQEVDGEVTLTVDLNRLVGEEDNPQNIGQIVFTPSDDVGVKQLPVTIKQFGETYVIPSADIGSRWFNSLLGAIDEARAMQKMLNWLSDVDFDKKSGVGSDPKHRITYSREVKNSYIQFLNGYALDFVKRFTSEGTLLGPMPVNEINKELVGPERANLPEVAFMRPLTTRQEMAINGLDLDSDQMIGMLMGEDVQLSDEQKITEGLAKQKANDPSTESIRKMWSSEAGQKPDDYNYRVFLNRKFEDQVVVKNEDSQFVPNRNRLYTQMLKRTIAYAVQNGYDGISVSSPQSHVKRWGREYQVLYNDIYGKRIPNTLKKLTGLPLKSVQLNATVDGTPNKTEDNIGERIAIKFTPEATARIRNEGFQFARQGETPAVGVSTEQAVQAAQDLAKRLNVADDIRISISEGELAEGVKGAVLRDGHILVSAKAHASVDDIKQTILHEMVGHYGIRRILSQGDLDILMTRINLEAQRSPEFKTQIEEVRKRGYDEGDPMVFVEEVLAMMAETEMSQFAQLKNDIVAIFTRLMRALGINTSAITKAEVLQLLGQSKRALQAKPESDSVIGRGETVDPLGDRNMPDKAINVRVDNKAGIDYAELIVSGEKTYETRDTDSLRPYVGTRVGIAKTGDGQTRAIGSVEIGEPIVVDEEEFRRLEAQHRVPKGSQFDIKSGGKKYLYPVSNPERFNTQKNVGKGIVSRELQNEPAFESRRREGDRAGYFDMTKENVDANIRDAEAIAYYGADQTKGYFVRMPIDDFLLLTTHEGFTRGGHFYAPYTKDKILEEGPSTSNVSDNVQNRFDPEEVDRPDLNATPFLILRDDEDESGNPIVKVAGHEGRHRAALASAEGATTMPVFIRYEDKLIFDFEENKARGGKQDFEDLTASREVVGEFDETRRVILPKGVEATYSARERAYDIMTSRAEESELGLEPAFLRKDEAGLVSSSLPTAKKPDGDALKERLIVGFDRAKSSPDYFKKITTTVKGYGNWKTTKRNPNVIAEEFIDLTVDNLLYLYDSVPENIRDRSKLWYVGANKLSSELADKYDFSVSQVAGVMAAMSPQKDWYQNYRLGELVIDAYQNGDKLFDQAMSDWLTSYKEKKKEEERKAKKKKKMTDEQFDLVFDNILSQVNDRSLAEVDGKYKAHWIRAYVEANLDRRYRIVEPEGTLGDFATTQDGAETNAAFGSMSEIFKAVSILLDGSLENISSQLGDQHKVRSFYNNILMPMDDQGDVTIDTHAVAAALLLPFSASSTEVLHNFGGGAASTQVQGLNGTYPLYAEGYRRAARQRDVLPREMQSVTWEAVRGLFPRAWKSKENLSKSRQIWLKYKTGGKSLDEVRNEIVEFAGGVRNPDWAD